MATNKMNILVYTGTGSTLESVRHCLYSLRRLLSPNYAVLPITGETILKEPWLTSCALLVFPGGADLGYCKTLNGLGNRRIKQYVNNGGSYLGLCAGGYYGSGRCEFEVGNEKMEVIGDRELKFFPGTCRGTAFPGFVYNSEAGARAASISVEKKAFASGDSLPDTFRTYFNGGSAFVDAPQYKDRGVEILANYTEHLNIDPGDGAAAVVYCKVGDGHAILTGPHPEFAAVNLSKKAKGMDPAVVDALAEDDKPRTEFLKACLLRLGLRVNEEEKSMPSLSRIHVSSSAPAVSSQILSSLQESTVAHDGEQYIKGQHDTFHLEKPTSAWSMGSLTRAILEAVPGIGNDNDGNNETVSGSTEASTVDYDDIIKRLVIHETDLPPIKETPSFNHRAYFSDLAAYSNTEPESLDSEVTFGTPLLYGEVVTSTSTLLEKNLVLTNALPSGATMTATNQLTGRGRGSNVWLSPPGALMFSTVVRHPLAINATAPVVFIQYIAALAVVEGVKSYGAISTTGNTPSIHSRMPVKLKWPNDIYALDPSRPHADPADPNAYTKIGGVLVNSSYSGGDYTLIIGIGLNMANAAPTTSLNAVLEKLQSGGGNAATFTAERLLARILTSFHALYGMFCKKGFAGPIEELYYKHWLHDGQIVRLESEGGAKARIVGITRDWGLLLAEEIVGEEGRERVTGKRFALQSDSNSFDFFRGLVRRKL